MVAPPGAPSPSILRGVREEREERRAYPGPRQTIRVMTLGLMMGCLKSESGKWGRAGVQCTRRHGRIDAKRHARIYSGHPRLACCDVVKAWMPGTRPGMTDEKSGTGTQRRSA